MKATTARAAFLTVALGTTFGMTTHPTNATRAQQWNAHEVLNRDYTDTPSFVSGEFRVDTRSTDPVVIAKAFLSQNRDLIGIDHPEAELKVMQVIGPDEVGMTHVKFQHVSKGLRVFGSELIVHERGSVVTSMNGTFLPSFDMSAASKVTGESATDLAIADLARLIENGFADGDVAGREDGLIADRAPELLFYNKALTEGKRGDTELAWSISVNSYVYFVSAVDGRIIDSWDNVHHALNREIYTANNATTLPGKLVCKEGSGCSSNDTDAKLCYDQFSQTYNYFKSTHNRDSYDNKGAKLIGSVHYSEDFVNAYWNGTQMVFGDDMVADDVTAHELAHAVTQFTANLTYKDQSGALNESFSDCYAVMVDRTDWLIGEDLPIGAIRSMSDPGAYNQPKDMSEYKSTKMDNGGVHTNSGIPNYACYLVSAGGTNKGVTVKPATREITEQVWYRTESTKLTSSSQFSDFAKLAIEACGEKYGKGTEMCKSVEDAMKATQMSTTTSGGGSSGGC